MGRVAFEWQKAFQKSGYEFKHIGINELPNKAHPLLYGWYFRRYILKENLKPNLIIAHEPVSGFLKFKNIPLIIISHGIEERAWVENIKYGNIQGSGTAKPIPIWIRFFSNNYGFKKAAKIFLLNSQDAEFLTNRKSIAANKICVVKNGYYYSGNPTTSNDIHFLFNATWMVRKGIGLLVKLFNSLDQEKKFTLTIAGSGGTKENILLLFNPEIRNRIDVLPAFDSEKELEIYKKCNVFLMPSYFEGQSLALIQAMAMGLCPLASDNSGQLDLIEHERNGILFKTGDLNDFKSKVDDLFNHLYNIKVIGENAANSVSNNTWEAVTENVVKECESVMH